MTSSGPVVKTPYDFYYYKLCNLVNTGTESDLQPYLTPPECEHGVYHLYTQNDHIYLEHIYLGDSTLLIYDSGKWHSGSFRKTNATYLGPHNSLESVYDTHPELFI